MPWSEVYDFVDDNGTFAQWLSKNLYTNDKSKGPIEYMMKDPFDQVYIKEAEKTSRESHPRAHEITNPLVMFMKQMIIRNTTQQTTMVDEILTRKVLQSKIGGTSLKKQYVLRQKSKIVTTMATKS